LSCHLFLGIYFSALFPNPYILLFWKFYSNLMLTAVSCIPCCLLHFDLMLTTVSYSCLLHSDLTLTAVYYIPVTCLQLFITFWSHAYSCFICLLLMLLALSCIHSSSSLSSEWLHSSFEVWDC
jgi:hypothetical protein